MRGIRTKFDISGPAINVNPFPHHLIVQLLASSVLVNPKRMVDHGLETQKLYHQA